MSRSRLLRILALTPLLGGCSAERIPILEDMPSPTEIPWVYRIDIQQGNVVTQEMLAQLRPGMDKRKVRYIMGTPLVIDTFHQDRWDYIYSFRKGSSWTREQRRISLFFENGKLARVEGDVRPAQGPLQAPQRHRTTKVVVPGEYEEGFLEKMKATVGFGSDEKELEPLPSFQQEEEDHQAASPETAAAPAQEQQEAGTAVTVPPDTVTLKEEEERKKGFFRRLLEKIGVGDNEDEEDYEPAEPKYRDPTNPDPAAGSPGPLGEE